MMPDELDSLSTQYEQEDEKASALRGSMTVAVDRNPDQYSKAIDISRKVGVSPSEVAKDPSTYEVMTRKDIDYGKMIEDNPGFAGWMIDQDNASVAHDDIPTLQKIGTTARDRALKAEEARVAEDNRRRGAGVYSGLGATALGGVGTLASTIKDAQSATIRATVGKMFGQGAVETLETVGMVNPLQWAINGLDLEGKKLTAWAKPYEYETENLVVKDPVTGEEFLNFGAANPSNPKGLMNAAKIIAGELAPTAATIGLAYVTGGAGAAGAAPKVGRLLALAQRIGQYAVSAPGLLEVGRTVQGQYQNGVQFLMSKDPTLSQEDAGIKAAPGALLAGLLSGPTGAAMEGKILNDLMTKVAKAPGAQSIIKKWGSKLLSLGITGAKEGAQEVVQGFAEDLADWVTINPDKTLVQVAGNAIQNLTGGVAMGGGMHLMIPGGHGPDKPVGNIQDLVDAAKESKLLKRSPEKFREAAGSMLQGETTLIEPGAFIEYFQSQGLDPYAMADKVGVKNLDEALASGNPLIMDTADYLTQLAVDHHEGLAPDLRTSIGEWTPRMQEENAAALETAREEMVQAQQGIEAAKTLTLKEQIREDLVRKFDPLFEPSTAGTYADAFANILATLEIRSGQDLSKWREGLTVSRPMEGERGKPVQDVILNRLQETGKINLMREGEGNRILGQGGSNAATIGHGTGGGISETGVSETASARAERQTRVNNPDIAGSNYGAVPGTFNGSAPVGEITLKNGIPAQLYLDGENIMIVARDGGDSAFITGSVVGNDVHWGELGQVPGSEIKGKNIGQTLIQELVNQALKIHPDVAKGELLAIAGGTRENPEAIKKVLNRYESTVWGEGDAVSILNQDVLATPEMAGQTLYQPAPTTNLRSAIITGIESKLSKWTSHADVPELIEQLLDSHYTLPEIHKELRDMASKRIIELSAFSGLKPQTARQEELSLDGPQNTKLAHTRILNKAKADEIVGVGQTLYQSAPTFYSALERVVPDLAKIASKDGMISPDQAKSWLAARQKEGKFKQAELDAVGLPDWLDLQKGKVSVNDIKNFVEQNGVQIQEVMKGETLTSEESTRLDELDSMKRSDMSEAEKKEFATLMRKGPEAPSTKYGPDENPDWTLPGGKNYKELLLTLPSSREGDGFSSQHWDEPNVLSHIRFNERTDAEGKTVLFIEEIQSDWGQTGKKKGFDTGQNNAENERIRARKVEAENNYKKYRDMVDTPNTADGITWKYHEKFGNPWAYIEDKTTYKTTTWGEATSEQMNIIRNTKDYQDSLNIVADKNRTGDPRTVPNEKHGIPSAPFVEDTKAWVSLSLKRMIRYAAANGFDKVAFVNGEQSADRYDLSKQIDSIRWAQGEDGKFSIGATKDGSQQIGKDDLTIQEVADLVGKDVAEKIQEASKTEIDGELSGVDLKVGGEGMKTFYDKIVPQITSEVLKKTGGGKLGEVVMGDLTQPGFDITPEMKAKVMEEGQTLFQDDRQRRARQAMGRSLSPSGQGAELNMRADEARMSEASFQAWEEEIKAIQLGTVHEGKRGFIQFGDGYQVHVGLLESSNLSTLIHEIGGHFAFEIMGDLALRPDTPQQIKDDYAKLLEAVGAVDGVVGNEQHENFARLTEAYFMEGKAPSEELRGTFARVKEWMKLIYRQIKNLGVKLSPEVRAVFDRMYATDEAIAQARENSQETRKLISKPENVGWDQATFDLYGKLIARGQEKAAVTVEQKLIAEAQRQHEDWYKAERETVRADVETGVDSRKDFKDLKALQRGQLEDGTPMKLDRAQIVALIGEKETQTIARSKGAVYVKEGGVDIDTAAEIMGYESGRQLVETLAGMPKRSELIERLTDEIMKAKHGDMATDGTLADEAMLAVHQQVDAERMMMELQAFKAQAKAVDPLLKKQRRDAKGKAKSAMADIPPIATFRAAALEIVNSQKIMDLNPERYRTTGLRESKKAFEAMGKQDFEAGAAAKKNELMNHFLYLEAVKAKALAEKQAGKARDLAKPAAQKRVGKAQGDYLNQLNSILDQFEFAKIPIKDILARQHGREEWVNGQIAANGGDGTGVIMPDPILFDEEPKNYKELTPPELSAVMDMLNNIQAVARNQSRYTLGNEEADFEAEKAQFISNAYANNTVKNVRRKGAYEGFWDKRMRQLRGIDAEMTKMEWLIDQLDGGDVNGPARRNIKKPIDDASAARNALMKEVFAKVRAAFEARPKAERQGEIQKLIGIRLPGMTEDLNQLQNISFWLNMGNVENEKVAMEGEGLQNVEGIRTVEAMRKAMSASDWKFVQDVWDGLESTKERLFQVEKQMTGLEPIAKTLTPFDVKMEDGTVIHMRGGYYPLRGDSVLDAKGELMEDPFKHLSVGSMKPSTKTSAAQKVSGATYRLLLDYRSILGPHLKSVVTRITMGEAIRNVSRFISDKDVMRTLQETLNVEEAKQFNPWLQDMSNTETVDEGPVMRWLMKRRSAMTTAVLIGNLGSLLIQGSDVVKPAMEILNWNPTKFFGVLGYAKAYFDVLSSRKMVEWIKEKSPNEMRFRADNFQRDLREMEEARGALGEGNARVSQFLGQGFMVMDSLTAFPAWLAKYRQGMDEHGNEAQAVMEADRMVARRLQAGENRNMSQMFRRPGASKLFTTFMGDANTLYGIVAASVKSGSPAKMTSAIMAVVLSQMIGQMLKNRGPEDDDDWLPWMGEQALKGVSGVVPGVSDLVDVGINTVIKGRKADLRNPVIAALVKPFEAMGSVKKAAEGEKDPEEALMDALDAAGAWGGIPGTSQIIRTWKYVHHVNEGEQAPETVKQAVADALLGPKPKKK